VRGRLDVGPLGIAGSSLTQAVRYASSHGGGTVAVSSQSQAATAVIGGARVAGIGGFSGRESETTAAWLAQEVRAGHIRWVLLDGAPGSAPGGAAEAAGGAPGGAPGAPHSRDARRGARSALSAATAACRPVSAVSGLYDCAGRAAQIASAAGG
jgi:hypothetical protein